MGHSASRLGPTCRCTHAQTKAGNGQPKRLKSTPSTPSTGAIHPRTRTTLKMLLLTRCGGRRIRNGEGVSLSERFAQFDSPAVGRWVVYMGVPRVVIRNVCDEELCLLLTPAGFIVLGAGKNPAALRVEGGGEPEVMSVADAKRFIRHQPTQDDDPSEIEGYASRRARVCDTGAGLTSVADAGGMRKWCDSGKKS
eukprot:2000930-Rhodomonas_salina.1